MSFTILANRTLQNKIPLFYLVIPILVCCFWSIKFSFFSALLYSRVLVPCPRLSPFDSSRFWDRYPLQFDLSLSCNTSSFSLFSLEHVD